MSDMLTLSAADYAIVGVMLTISAGIGLFFRIFGGKQTTNEEYILAGRDMFVFPVAVSLMATFMSAPTLMGIPSEMYMYGTSMAFISIGFLLGPIISSFVFLPIYFKTGITTTYEYLELRFGKSTRSILSLIFLFNNLLFSALSLYVPALALSAVTNLTVWASIVSVGSVCTLYSALGGMKAVVWSEVFQSVLMYICVIVIIVKGSIDLGGLKNVFEKAYDGGRIILPTFEMDFSRHYTMWNIFLYGLILTTYNYATEQTLVQRQLTVKNLERSRMVALLSSVMVIVFQLLCCLCGLIIYVHFKTCDPMSSQTKSIHSADQLLAYYVTSTMRQYPGLPGLCITGIFSASLSTVSSVVNSMAAVTYEDIIRLLWPGDSRSVFLTRTASVIYGILCIFLASIVASFGNIFKANVLICGMVAGPVLGVYILAALTRRTNEMGVNFGILAGFLFAICATFIPNERYYPELPVENHCSEPLEKMFNFSSPSTDLEVNSTNSPLMTNALKDNFPISYMWISSFSLLICVTVGYFVSLICSYVRGNFPLVEPEHLSPILRFWKKKDSPTKDFKKCPETT